MCDPLTIAGIALTAGSTVANSMAANKAAKARSRVMDAERTRQAGLDKEAQALNTQSQDRFKTFGEDMGQRGQQLGDYLNQPLPTDDVNGAPTEVLPASDSAITVQETGRQKQAANKFGAAQGKARGNLLSFGDFLGDVSRQQAREAGLVGQIGGFKQGSSSIVPYEMDSANHAGDSMKMFGDILNLGGSLALGKGLQGDWAANPTTTTVAPVGGGGMIGADVSGPWGASLAGPPPIPRFRYQIPDLYDTGRR